MHRIQRLYAVAALVAGFSMPLASRADTPTHGSPYRSALTPSTMYQILLAEISANNADWANAHALTLDAARKTGDVRLYERAVDLGLRGRSADLALQAAAAWLQAYPASKEANRYVLQIAVGTNRLNQAAEPLQRELAGRTGDDRVAAINQIPRYFANVADKSSAVDLVGVVLAADLASTAYGPAAWAALGSVRLAAGDTAGALDAAQRAAALDARAEAVAVLALNLLDLRVGAAEEIVRNYLQGEALPQWRLAYVRFLIGTQRYAQALEQSKILNQQHPSYADAWLLRGSLELQNRALAAAQASLQTYLGLQPGENANPEAQEPRRGAEQAYFLLAQIAEQNGQIDAAQAYLERIQSPQDALRVHTLQAQILARQGQMDQARARIRSIPEQEPDHARAKLAIEIQLLRDHKHHAAAYTLLQQATQKYPADADLAYELAMVAEKLGKTDEMEAVLRKLIATTPNYHHAYNALGYALADRNERLPEARALIQKALEFAPTDPFILDSLAWVEYRSGNLALAQRLLQDVFAQRKDAEIAAHLGEVLWVQGQHEAATAVWRQGLELQKDNETLLETMRRLQPKL